MKKYNKTLLFISVATLASVPVTSVTTGVQRAYAVQNQVPQQLKPAVSLGASLNDQQRQETLQLLGAGQVQPDSITNIDGTIVDKYIHDGSNESTPVYSSAFIQPMQEGHGVQVQIVTPQNILNVSQLTYQNAAITAGAKNALIRVATVNPVTGDGALAGVYEVLSKMGTNLNNADVNTAQKEINLVSEIGKQTGLNNNQMNLLFTELKKAVIEKGELSKEDIIAIAKKLGIEIDDTTAQKLLEFAQEFAKTEAAKNKETIDQLESSSIPAWKEVLPTLGSGHTMEEIEAREPLDLSQAKDVRPEIKALADYLNNQQAKDASAKVLYGASFIPSTFNEDLNKEEKKALNDIRTELYYIQDAFQTAMTGSSGVNQELVSNATLFENLQISHPEIAEIFLQVGLANGMMPQAYSYHIVGQEGTRIAIEVHDNTGDQLLVHRYAFDTATQEVLTTVDGKEYTPVNKMDFTAFFNGAVEDKRQNAVAIPADYQVDSTMIEESFYGDTSEETTESTEETIEESNDTTEVVSEEVTDTPSVEETVAPETMEELTTGEQVEDALQ